MSFPRPRVSRPVLALLLVVTAAPGVLRLGAADDKGRKPSLSLKVTPGMASAPVRVRAVAELKGGADDYADFYCPTIEWDWGDDTRSEATKDCPPYVAGASQIARRVSAEHTYREAGNFRVVMRLKQKDRVVGFTVTPLQVQPGLSGAQ